ncbi:MAG: FHA domain-containing protein [Bacteroidaceae bacterium]|nr:FHA domain-containing protein [Bacteroidaceae bacterium]
MEIIIGREEGARRLHCIANGKEFNIGQAGSVPSTVSRQHCRITVLGEKISIENLKEQNITYVDGIQVFSKAITPMSIIQLGSERFNVPLKQILDMTLGKSPVATGPQSSSQVPTYSLTHLKSVWDEYDRRKLKIQEKAVKDANMSRLQGILSMCGMCIGFIPGIATTFRVIIIVAALAIAIYFFLQGMSNDTVQKKLHDLDEEFANKYKCPNPSCGKPFGSIPYRQIEYNKQCIACGCKYTH